MPERLYNICIIVLLALLALQQYRMSSLEADNSVLQYQCDYLDETLRNEQAKFKQDIDKLKAEIAEYSINAELYTCKINDRSRELDEKAKAEESKIQNELQSDSSNDNQLNISRRIIHDFSSKKD